MWLSRWSDLTVKINLPRYAHLAAVINAEVNELGAPVLMAEHGHCQISSKAAISANESSRRVDKSLDCPGDHQ
jgi:hypothetical protein